VSGSRSPRRRSALAPVAGAIAFLWLVFIVDVILRGRGVWLHVWLGRRPRDPAGSAGILGAHVLHAGLDHIIANTVALAVLGVLACWFSRRLTLVAVIIAALASGILTWLIAPAGTVHVGASGIVFGLLGLLIGNGLFRGSWLAFAIALPIGALYWASALAGMLPTEANQQQSISWQMHLGGFAGGLLTSWLMRDQRQ
jgi:membrane associated rhomboid family serine protease